MNKDTLIEVELYITKASLQEDGTMRWQAVCSDTGTDKTNEATTLALFSDWIDRAQTGKSVGFLPAPRQPFLGLSHYPDLGGYGEAGTTDRLHVDGNRFKASGVFHGGEAHPLGKALFDAIRKERGIVKRGGDIAQPIRISAGWWDLAHQHGDFIFERKSLSDVCPMCKSGAGEKKYIKGQLDHFAATRVPINPRTSLALEEKAAMTTRKEDAKSIIEDETLADELDKRAALTGKAETEGVPDGMVTKAKDKKPPPFVKDEEAEDEEMEGEEGKKTVPKKKKAPAKTEPKKADVEKMGEEMQEHRPFNGAKTLKEAEAYNKAREQAGEVYSQWSLFQTVMGNILSEDEPGEVKGAVDGLVNEFSNRIAAIKAAVEDVVLLQPVGGLIMADEQEYQQETEGAEGFDVKAAVNEALTNPEMDRQQKAEAIQLALETFAETIKAQLNTVAPPDPGEAITKAMTPIVEKLDLLISKLGSGQAQTQVPAQKSMAPNGMPQQGQNPQLPVSPITGQPSGIRAMINRSVGMQQ